MRSLQRTRVPGAVLALALAATLCLGGCSDDEEGGSRTGIGSTGAAAAGTADAEQDASPDPAEPGDAEPAAESDEPDGVLTGEACVYGTWYFDNDSFRALLEKSGGKVREVTGKVTVIFGEDGSTSTQYDEWTTVVDQDGAVARIVRNGEDLGTFKLAGNGSLTMTETKAGSVLTMTVKAKGQPEIKVSPPRQPSPLTQATITCEGDTMNVLSEGETSILRRDQ